MRLGLRARLLLLLLPGIAFALALDSWADHRARLAAIDDALDEVLLQPIAVLDEALVPATAGGFELKVPFDVQAMFAAMPARRKDLYVGVRRAGSQPERAVLGKEPLPEPPPGTAPATGAPNLITTEDTRVFLFASQFHGMPVRVATLERDVDDSAGQRWRVRIQAAESTERRDALRRESMRRELWQDLRTLLIAAALVVLGISWTLRPLGRLRDLVKRRPPGQLEPLPAGDVPHEVRPLVEAVNESVERHGEVLRAQERFLADAAHQLRTPVAVMMTQAGYAQRSNDPQAVKDAVAAIGRQLQRSRRIADQLLAMSHAVTGSPEAVQPIDLAELAREGVLDALPMARERGVDLGVEEGGPPPFLALALPAEIHEALANLLHNAVRHAPRGGSVTARVGRDAHGVFVDVCDTGPGIAPHRREAVFERFASRNLEGAEAGGAGLGLAIARAYARRRGGDVTLHDAPGGGLTARLRLPASH